MKSKTLISLLIMLVSLFVMNAVITDAQETSPRLWLSPATFQAQPGQEFIVTVNVAEAAGVYGGSFKLAYDPQVLEVVINDNQVFTAGDFFDGRPSFTLKNSANAQQGVIEYALTLTQPAEPVNGAGVLGTVTFRALSEASVSVTPIEARLLSPEFTEVDGRLIAQRINEVEARMEGMALSITANDAPQIVAVSAQPEVRTGSNIEEPMIVLSRADVVILAAAGAFFIAGLALFTMTVGMYARLNMRLGSRRLGQYV
jgi:hypothetical protein